MQRWRLRTESSQSSERNPVQEISAVSVVSAFDLAGVSDAAQCTLSSSQRMKYFAMPSLLLSEMNW